MTTRSWEDIQQGIDACKICRLHIETKPARPPAPIPGSPLFMTEAPSESGGFWRDSKKPDRLRRVLFSMLRDLSDICLDFEMLPLGSQGREVFQQRLFLIQSLKWPLNNSGGSLPPQIRKSIRHSVQFHLADELREIRPRGIFASGAVAGLACCLLAPHSGLCEFFSSRAFEEEVAGSRIEADFPYVGHIPVYFSHLLVDRFQGRTKDHVRAFVIEMLEESG